MKASDRYLYRFKIIVVSSHSFYLLYCSDVRSPVKRQLISRYIHKVLLQLSAFELTECYIHLPVFLHFMCYLYFVNLRCRLSRFYRPNYGSNLSFNILFLVFLICVRLVFVEFLFLHMLASNKDFI